MSLIKYVLNKVLFEYQYNNLIYNQIIHATVICVWKAYHRGA